MRGPLSATYHESIGIWRVGSGRVGPGGVFDTFRVKSGRVQKFSNLAGRGGLPKPSGSGRVGSTGSTRPDLTREVLPGLRTVLIKSKVDCGPTRPGLTREV